MSYWSNNPELYTEIVYKQMFKEGLVDIPFDEADDPDDVVSKLIDSKDGYKVAMRAEQDYWGSRIDHVMDKMKER
jgi:hypothetical protein